MPEDFPSSELVGAFARAFDLIQHHYGWTDDIVLDLSIKRTRQILAAIKQREWNEHTREEDMLEWQTKHIGTFLANLGRSQKHANAMHRAVGKIHIREHRARSSASSVRSTEQALADGWTPDGPVDYDDPRFARNSYFAVMQFAQRIGER